VVAFRTLLEWGIDPGAKSALKEGRWFAWAISLFVLAGALSALFSIDPLRSWKAVLRYSTYPVVAIGILRTGQRNGGGWIRNLCLLSAVVPCVCALLQVWDPSLNFGDRDWKAGYAGDLGWPAGPGHPPGERNPQQRQRPGDVPDNGRGLGPEHIARPAGPQEAICSAAGGGLFLPHDLPDLLPRGLGTAPR